MYTVAFIMKRRPGLTLEQFLAYYRDRHAGRMVELMRDRGLLAYEHFPVAAQAEGRYLAEGGPAYDAVSVYSFTSEAEAEACWALPDVIADSEAFIDFDTMVALPADRRTVFMFG